MQLHGCMPFFLAVAHTSSVRPAASVWRRADLYAAQGRLAWHLLLAWARQTSVSPNSTRQNGLV